jgi:hypothetical protein
MPWSDGKEIVYRDMFIKTGKEFKVLNVRWTKNNTSTPDTITKTV